ncbi:MAG: peptidoglycan DD-metalloendopeptidase family protein [Deltaproteobacteria bacterium]|nr:peptidoglycan DD-metalloendopeptidase family protein [Deltaproteobacteria bacterium]
MNNLPMDIRLFPSLTGKAACRVNLDQEAQKHFTGNLGKSGPMLDAVQAEAFITGLQQSRGCAWSYGGYLENRAFMFRGSYLDHTGTYLHLGTDFNVPAETPVVLPWHAEILVVDDDEDQNGGWGPRVIARPDTSERDLVVIFAHLAEVQVAPGRHYRSGTVLAQVGSPPFNGNWWPHLHVQLVLKNVFDVFVKTGLDKLDGYGHPTDIERLQVEYPDPLSLL